MSGDIGKLFDLVIQTVHQITEVKKALKEMNERLLTLEGRLPEEKN